MMPAPWRELLQIGGRLPGGVLEQAQNNLNRVRPIAIAELRQWSDDVGYVLDKLAETNLPGGFF
jgi:hypothetical protein